MKHKFVDKYQKELVKCKGRTFEVSKKPMVKGSGKGRNMAGAKDVNVTVNSMSVVVESVDCENGIVKLDYTPNEGDEILVEYYYKA